MQVDRLNQWLLFFFSCLFFFQAEDGIRDFHVTGVQTCALPILNGYLWAMVNDSGDHRMVKIDPVSGAVVATSAAIDSGYLIYCGFIALPDGGMMTSLGENEGYKKMSADLQTFSDYAVQDSFHEWTYVTRSLCPLIGTRGLSLLNSGGGMALVDYDSASVVGSEIPTDGYMFAPASVVDSNTIAVMANGPSPEFVPRLHFVNATTGDLVQAVDLDSEIYLFGFYPIADAWGYGIRNIQGSRL